MHYIDTAVVKAKKLIVQVLTNNHTALTINLPEESLHEFAAALYEVCLITNALNKAPSFEKIISQFKANMTFQTTIEEIQEHCLKLLKAFHSVGASYTRAASFLRKKWYEILEDELGIDFELNFED